VYEDPATQSRAAGFCDELVGRFWKDLEFDVGWWSFDHLQTVDSAREAADKAARADLIVFAASREGDFPVAVKAWIEVWLGQRGDREGKLVALLDPKGIGEGKEGRRHQHLRNAAHHAAMDYLTEVPEDISLEISESLDSYTERAGQVTSLLDDILRRQPQPPTLLP
jgi:hypothetical protein